MKRIIIFALILFFISGCAEAEPESFNFSDLKEVLDSRGFEYTITTENNSLFSKPANIITINADAKYYSFAVLLYADNESMEEDSAHVQKCGESYRGTKQFGHRSTPYVFKKGSVMIYYRNTSEQVLELLNDIFGAEFAGGRHIDDCSCNAYIPDKFKAHTSVMFGGGEPLIRTSASPGVAVVVIDNNHWLTGYSLYEVAADDERYNKEDFWFIGTVASFASGWETSRWADLSSNYLPVGAEVYKINASSLYVEYILDGEARRAVGDTRNIVGGPIATDVRGEWGEWGTEFCC
ncbi:MAG: hypothetical protein FWD48_10700 [Oscillospiraceae bacterium]|nr:hypothetical protein [Oscillospiraceae bacterium]